MFRTKRRARARVALKTIAAALAATSIGCPKAADRTPHVQATQGAARRVGFLSSHAAANRKSAAVGARVHPLAPGEELAGPNATGRPGDWVLENDEVVFVVDALGRGTGLAESGGNIVDAADAKTRRDELGQVFTYFGAFPRQGVYTAIDSRLEPDGTAVLVSRGTELYEPEVEVVTELRLRPGDRTLLLRTTLTNRGRATVKGLGLGDAVQWGGVEKIAPGMPPGFKGKSTGRYLGGVGRVASYAITVTAGDIGAISGSGWTDTEQKKDVAIEPGASIRYERVFVVGARPDSSSLVAELTRASGGALGELEVGLTDASGAPVKAEAGAKVWLGTPQNPEVLSLVATGEGTVRGSVPPGKWSLSFAPSVGRRSAGSPATVEVAANAEAKTTLAVTDAGSVSLGPCTESGAAGESAPTPCRITIEGLDGAEAPNLGPAHVAGMARNVVILRPSEVMTVPLAYGRYRLTASRGPEYDLTVAEITVPHKGAVAFALRRVVDTSGYVAADFHQHTIVGADAPVATRDRILANAAEGVEVAVASEHNTIGDLASLAKELALDPWVAEISGVELTSDASKAPFGHANVYPLDPDPSKSRNGAPPVRDRLASDVFAEALSLSRRHGVLQINHPRSGRTGYFDQLGFDPKTGVGTGAGYVASFDALEVWNGLSVSHRDRVLEDFFALLRTSHPVTPVADTDTHGVVGEEPGYPRTFVRLERSAEAPLSAWDAARSQELAEAIREARDVVLSNGPFMTVSANGARIGGVATARNGDVTVRVSVETAPWIAVDHVELRLARGLLPSRSSARLTPAKNASGALVSSATFTFRPKADDAVVVVVSGTKPMRPVLSGDDADLVPWAMSAPIWIDADGNGIALGRRAPRTAAEIAAGPHPRN